MIIGLGLLLYGTLIATTVPRMLDGAAWTDQAPRLAIVLWQALTSSVLLALVLAGLSGAMSSLEVSGSVGQLLHSCAVLLREQYGTTGQGSTGVAGLVLVAVIVGRSLWAAIRVASVDRRRRRAHLDTLTIVGARAHGRDAVIIEHPIPAAYCLPGRRHCIVITSAALHTLRPAELRAVLAHERAHVRGRHHLPLIGARVAAAAFPHIRLFRSAACEIARLLELLADDAAARGTDPHTVASALLRVAAGRAPAAALAANGAEVAKRVHRLLSPRCPLGGSHRLVLITLSAVAIPGPVALALLPVLSVLTSRYAHLCPIPNL